MTSLGRRSLLRGLATAGMTLPLLELGRSSRAHAGGGAPPKRYVFVFGGVSTGRGYDGQQTVPTITGPGYDLPRALLALGGDALPYGGTGYGVKDEVSVVTGLKVPWATAAGAMPPPGGRSAHFHNNTIGPIVSGMNSGPETHSLPRGVSHDQLIADALLPKPQPGQQRMISLRVQPERYIGGTGYYGDFSRISWHEQDGEIVGIDPISSPRLAYESLFGNFTPPDPADAAAAAFTLSRRRSVLDTLHARTNALLPRMGGADRERMQRHLDELGMLEAKLDAMPPVTAGACELLPDPGEDPPIGTSFEVIDQDHLQYDDSAAYSDEELRATLMMDYVRMAFACDLTRVATVRLTMDQSWLNAGPLVGAPSDFHQLSHGAVSYDAHADGVGWHIKHFARLVQLLRDTTELDGSSLLDNTVVVLCFEGGFGYDPEASADGSPHSTENMVMLTAGRAGGLVHGEHVVATDQHPANVLVSAMQAVGMETDTLGEISGTVPGLLG